jgi:hypothetical protein
LLSLPIPLRLLLAAQPQLLAPLLQVIHRVIAGFLVKRAGFKLSRADTGAVTLIQRFGSAANLNIHLLEKEADDRTVRQAALRKIKRHAERVVAEGCKKNGVWLTELRNGSRRGKLPEVRAQIVKGLVEGFGLALAEVARQVGISTSGVAKILTRSLSE